MIGSVPPPGASPQSGTTGTAQGGDVRRPIVSCNHGGAAPQRIRLPPADSWARMAVGAHELGGPRRVSALPEALQREDERIKAIARAGGLDFVPVIYQMLDYDGVSIVASQNGFPRVYPDLAQITQYEQLSKSYELGLSKIYELVINTNPAYAYLLDSNTFVEQQLVMCHVLGHVDFFKNNMHFRITDLGRSHGFGTPQYNPVRNWIDRMANHAVAVERIIDRHGYGEVEAFIDDCLRINNLIDPYGSRDLRAREEVVFDDDDGAPLLVPRLRAKQYMDSYINPQEYLDQKLAEMEKKRAAELKRQHGPSAAPRDIMGLVLMHAPLEPWQRKILSIIRDEAYYFLPQMGTKIMNEGWASFHHSELMTKAVADWSGMVDYAHSNAKVLSVQPGQLNPYALGVAIYRNIEERWNRGQHGPEWERCNDAARKADWDLRREGEGRKKIFEVRRTHNDWSFVSEFFTPELALETKIFEKGFNPRTDRWEIVSREFAKIKQMLLAQLNDHGNPHLEWTDINGNNAGELRLMHRYFGVHLNPDHAKKTLPALGRLWKRPVSVCSVSPKGEPVEYTYKNDKVVSHGLSKDEWKARGGNPL